MSVQREMEPEHEVSERSSWITSRRWVFVWLMPLIWAIVAALSILYPGGENLAMALAVLPGLLIRSLIGDPTNNSLLLLLTGLPVVAIMGLLLDWARISLKTFFVSFAAGVIFAFGLTLIFFVGEVNRSGFNRAFSRFDFDQSERRVAWQLLCTSLGLYVSVPIAAIAHAAQVLRKSR